MIDRQPQNMVTRRGLIKKVMRGAAALTIAGAVIGGGWATPASAGPSAGPSYFKTTAALNLRSQANTSSAVILVIPNGGSVTKVGADLNGFKNVSYNGKTGYANADYLVVEGDGNGGDMPASRGVAATTGAANMRSGPSTQFGVLRVILAHTTVEIYDEFANNYWLVSYNGQFGYVHSSLLSSDGGATKLPMTTTVSLNMRTESNANGELITVVPAGAQVIAGPAIVNGYRGVTYGQHSGWVLSAYLK